MRLLLAPIVLALACSGCAAWFAGGDPSDGYPDADLASFGLPAAGQHTVTAEVDAHGEPDGYLIEERTQEVTLPPGTRGQARYTETMSGSAGREEHGRVVTAYDDRVEVTDDQSPPFIFLRTPLRAGTRWRFPRRPAGTFMVREIQGVEDVCTSYGGFFKKALVVSSLVERRDDAGKPLPPWRLKEWIVPRYGQVQVKFWAEDHPADVTVQLLSAFYPDGKPNALPLGSCP